MPHSPFWACLGRCLLVPSFLSYWLRWGSESALLFWRKVVCQYLVSLIGRDSDSGKDREGRAGNSGPMKNKPARWMTGFLRI